MAEIPVVNASGGAAPGGAAPDDTGESVLGVKFIGGAATTIARRWPMLALRGVAALLFGVLTMLNPAATLTVLVFLFGGFALIDGALSIAAGMRRRDAGASSWGGLLVTGALVIAIGALVLWYPRMTTRFLVYVVAAWALVSGVGQIVTAIRLRREIRGEWLLGLSGAIAVIFALVLLFAPGVGALAVTLWIGIYAIAAGALMLVLAFRFRKLAQGGVQTLTPAAR